MDFREYVDLKKAGKIKLERNAQGEPTAIIDRGEVTVLVPEQIKEAIDRTKLELEILEELLRDVEHSA